MDNREIINETLVHLFHEIQKLEEEAIITEDFKDLTNNDMHIIEAVGLEGGNMSSIAAKLDITVGSLTTSMNSLVKKGYTERERSEKDRRIVYIHLTGKGRQAFHHHAKFHEQMTDAVHDCKDPKKVEMALWKIVPPEEGSSLCHRFVEHGREVCTARTTPHCERCVLADICEKNGVEK